MEHVGDCDANCNWFSWNGPHRLGNRAGRVGH